MTLGHDLDITDHSVAGMRRHAHAMLDEAWALGIRHYDAARSYGEAETFLGEWLRAKQPEGVFISSKWGYRYTGGWSLTPRTHEEKDLSRAHLDTQWPETQAQVGRWLRLYQIHSATLATRVLEDTAVLARLLELKSSHRLLIGLSVTGEEQPRSIAKAMAASVDGVKVFDSVQATWNVLEPSSGAALAEAHAAGFKVILKETLANGRLSSRGEPTELHQWAQQHQTPIEAVALASALQQPFADIVLTGAATIEHLRISASARQLGVLDDAPSIAEEPGTYWHTRSKLGWT